MSSIVRVHLIERAVRDMVVDMHESAGISYSDWVDYSFGRGLLRTIAAVDPKRPPPDHLPLCLRCRCGNCAANIGFRDRGLFGSPAIPGDQHQPASEPPEPTEVS